MHRTARQPAPLPQLDAITMQGQAAGKTVDAAN